MPVARLAALLVTVALAGCDVSGRVEREVEAALAEAVGPAESYDVEVEGLSVRSGEAERVTAVGRRVRPEGAPVLDRLDLDLRGVRYDRGARRLERVESARGTVRLAPADLAAFLETRDGVREASVSLEAPDRATVRVRPDLGGVSLPSGAAVEVGGRLAGAGREVRFEVESVRALGLDLGGTVARRLSGVLNPLVDLGGARPALDVTDVRVENGAVVVEVTGDLDGLRVE
jgi:hypothetical protein